MHNANWLKFTENLIVIETVRSADNIPFGIITHKFVYSKFPLIYQKYDKGSLHEFIKTNYS